MAARNEREFFLLRIDRRIVYVAVAIALATPLMIGRGCSPARMQTAEQFHQAVEDLEMAEGQVVLVAMDWGPGTKAENEPQSETLIRHLMHRRIKFALISTYYLARPFLEGVPERVAEELNEQHKATGETWEYGRDWVNLGYRPGYSIMVQGLAKTDDLLSQIKVDANGTPIGEIPCMKSVKTIEDVPAIAEFTGLVGALQLWLRFFQIPEHRPKYLHGCTSITIPEAYIYLDSEQLAGLLEGVAGAAYYSKLVEEQYEAAALAEDKERKDSLAVVAMTSLSIAHFVIILFIILGNAGLLVQVILRVAARLERRAAR